MAMWWKQKLKSSSTVCKSIQTSQKTLTTNNKNGEASRRPQIFLKTISKKTKPIFWRKTTTLNVQKNPQQRWANLIPYPGATNRFVVLSAWPLPISWRRIEQRSPSTGIIWLGADSSLLPEHYSTYQNPSKFCFQTTAAEAMSLLNSKRGTAEQLIQNFVGRLRCFLYKFQISRSRRTHPWGRIVKALFITEIHNMKNVSCKHASDSQSEHDLFSVALAENYPGFVPARLLFQTGTPKNYLWLSRPVVWEQVEIYDPRKRALIALPLLSNAWSLAQELFFWELLASCSWLLDGQF